MKNSFENKKVILILLAIVIAVIVSILWFYNKNLWIRKIYRNNQDNIVSGLKELKNSYEYNKSNTKKKAEAIRYLLKKYKSNGAIHSFSYEEGSEVVLWDNSIFKLNEPNNSEFKTI